MLDELFALMRTLEFEHDGWVCVEGHEIRENVLVMRLRVVTGVEGSAIERWEIRCRDFEAYQLTMRGTSFLDIETKHVLLWEYSDPHTSLYFYGTVDDPRTLIGALYARHHSVVSTWIPFHRYLRPLFAGSGFGLLASGPQILLREYADVLSAFGIKNNLTPPRRPKRWTGDRWVDEDRNLSVLIVGMPETTEISYVVAALFETRRVEDAE